MPLGHGFFLALGVEGRAGLVRFVIVRSDILAGQTAEDRLVRRDGKVDLGLWKNSDPAELVIPLDVHVYRQASELGLTKRRSKDFATAMEITDAFREIFPDDPAKGDFALFGFGVTRNA